MWCSNCESDSSETTRCIHCGAEFGARAQNPGGPPEIDCSSPLPAAELQIESNTVTPDPEIAACPQDKPAERPGNNRLATSSEPAPNNSADRQLHSVGVDAPGDNRQAARVEPHAEQEIVTETPSLHKPDDEVPIKQQTNASKIKSEQFNSVAGNAGIIAGSVYQIHRGDQVQFIQEERSFIEDTVTLPSRLSGLPDFRVGDLDEWLRNLREDHLIVISCADEAIAAAAGRTLIDQLDITNPQCKRLLDFERLAGDEPTIYAFLHRETNSDTAVAVLVDAVRLKARPFLDSLYAASPLSYDTIRDFLKTNRLFLICVTNSDEIRTRLENRTTHVPLFHWGIHFLHPLLNAYYPDQLLEIETILLRQYQQNMWGKDETEFCKNVRRLINQGRIFEVIHEDPKPIAKSLEKSFKGDGGLADSVIYIAAFFQDLTPSEFNQVVTALLEGQTVSVPMSVQRQNDDGSTTLVTVIRERKAIDLWRESGDSLRTSCGLIASDPPYRVIVFADYRSKVLMREFLEENYSFFLGDMFSRLQALGFLYSSSDKISASVTQLAIEMCLAYPDRYGEDWLFALVTRRSKAEHEAEHAPSSQSDVLSGRVDEFRPERLSRLIRGLYATPIGKPLVTNCLRTLITKGQGESALALIKTLRFAPGFLEIKWLRQLLDQGDSATRARAVTYLRKVLARSIYDALANLTEWLPEEGRKPESHSPSTRWALTLVLEYCLDTTNRFDRKYQGRWPSQLPLLKLEDARTSQGRLAQLMRFLTTRDLEPVLREKLLDIEHAQLLGALITEWAFILLGPQSTAASDHKNPSKPNSIQLPQQVVTSLLTQFTIHCRTPHGRELRREVLKYLEAFKNFLLRYRTFERTPSRELTKEVSWKYKITRELIVEIRSLQ